jgi:hypothetical protein
MKATLLDLLKQVRNPDTGWWGSATSGRDESSLSET